MNEVILAIKTLLENGLGSTYKKYYYGEIKVPNQAFMPFIEIIPLQSNLQNRGTGRMTDNTFTIQINIKNTLKKYLKETTNVEVIEHIQDLVKKMEDRETDGSFKENTVLGVLQNNLQLDGKAHINGNWNINYDDIDLGNGSYVTFASLTFTCNLIS